MIQNNVSMPSFKGLIYFKKEELAVNTDSIRTLQSEAGRTLIKYKNIYDSTGQAMGITTSVRCDIDTVIDAYKKACCCKDTVVTI